INPPRLFKCPSDYIIAQNGVSKEYIFLCPPTMFSGQDGHPSRRLFEVLNLKVNYCNVSGVLISNGRLE
ncbi:MAG TPA: hypothetical protein VLG45_12580, partial [Thermodesulfobacteriota bacterium]|nr:hypothetical protein [Thermodesulfobacteriota bacterium]